MSSVGLGDNPYLTVPQKVPTVVYYGDRVFKLLRNLPGQRTGARDWFEAFQDHLVNELRVQPLVVKRLPYSTSHQTMDLVSAMAGTQV